MRAIMMSTNLRATGELVIKRLFTATRENGANEHLALDIWEWPQGVALFGLDQYYQYTRDSQYLDYLENWFQKRVTAGLPPCNINTTAPFLTLIHLYELTRKPQYLECCRDWIRLLEQQLPHTEEQGLQHLTTCDPNEQQLWVDTLFMTVLFLAKFGQVTKTEKYIQEAIYQYLLHIKYLVDPVTGLWFHGWSFKGRHHFAKALWARGNSWYTAGVVNLIEILQLDGALRRYFITVLEAQVKQLGCLQDSGGLWRTLLDDPDSYLETSASAAFAYGILKAVRLGYLETQYAVIGRRATDGILRKIDPDGTVQGVSYGTAMGLNLEHYKTIPICPTAYGQGLVCLLFTELLRL
jgi:unsaturated rhamnogalacturonyl hydrolase